jgi:CubicO group peptidase (beta-lactamase class C family)
MTIKTYARTVLAAITLTTLLAACGASTKTQSTQRRPPKDPAATQTATSKSRPPASLPLEYAECMRAHGVPKFPNPVDGHLSLNPASGINPNSPSFRAAANACVKYGPSGAAPSGGAPAGGPSQPATGVDTKAATISPATWHEFADWLKQQATTDQFSGSVLVAHGDETLLDAGYGSANKATRTANTPDTLYCIASIGKLFTAVAIGQLAQQHKLAFDTPVGDYLPELPAGIGQHVTIGELADMTAGLGNVVLGQASPPQTLAEMVTLIAKERPAFKPGTQFFYSNDDYILLGAVIQKVSGQSYIDYLRQHILSPAGMSHTGYSTYIPAHVAGMAHGYALIGSKLHDISDQPQIANPSGGAYSTTGDLVRFAQALLDHKLLSPAMTKTILIPRVESPQPGGPAVDKYTYGFAYQQTNGITFIGHNGGTPGYSGQIDIYPRTGYVVAILTNQDNTMIPAIQRSEEILGS